MKGIGTDHTGGPPDQILGGVLGRRDMDGNSLPCRCSEVNHCGGRCLLKELICSGSTNFNSTHWRRQFTP